MIYGSMLPTIIVFYDNNIGVTNLNAQMCFSPEKYFTNDNAI